MITDIRQIRTGLEPELRIVFPSVFSDLFAEHFIYRCGSKLKTYENIPEWCLFFPSAFCVSVSLFQRMDDLIFYFEINLCPAGNKRNTFVI
ncbi:MAG: hypothetical protein EGQ81_05405 [Akkermansia sp.]|nr:hypothetical protein [Akkermansia sp.]